MENEIKMKTKKLKQLSEIDSPKDTGKRMKRALCGEDSAKKLKKHKLCGSCK